MRQPFLPLLVALATTTLCLTVQASYLEDEQPAGPDTSGPVRPTRPLPRPPEYIRPRPVHPNPLTEAVRRISIGDSYTHDGLTVFQLEASDIEDRTDYVSTEEGIRSGALLIREKGRGEVPFLVAENQGRQPVLMLNGEMVLGGKQNRILQEDVLLLPGSGPVTLPVFCIERGRWTGGDAAFSSKSSVAALEVRAAAQARRPQAEVWDSVHYYRSALRAPSATEDLQSVQDSAEAQEAARGSIEALRSRWADATVGIVVARWGRIVGADIFCNPAVFRKYRDHVIESYAMDCYAWSKGGKVDVSPPTPSPSEAQAFLDRVFSARSEWRDTPGDGRLLSVTGAEISGAALIHRDAVLHASLFSPQRIVPVEYRPDGDPRRRIVP